MCKEVRWPDLDLHRARYWLERARLASPVEVRLRREVIAAIRPQPANPPILPVRRRQ